ncbi:type IV pilin protein [Candidatus Avelusimicrobium luingense]|uniref:type IV pilin protein n=1 Tax=Candidatus Avelusimicrobium luingense TaxID=3416211 RepID=UPI003D142E40
MKNNQAFTLIELLVVVLIIGILAAVALPQYNKAVEKSRFMTLLPVAKSLADAEEAYYLTNGSYTTDVEELDVDFPAGGSVTSQSYYTLPNGARFVLRGRYLGGAARRTQLEWWLDHQTDHEPGPYCLADPTDPVTISVCKGIGTFTRHTTCGAIEVGQSINCDEYKIKL